MEKINTNNYKKYKVLFIVLSIITVAFTLTGNMLTSKEGAVSLTLFESFYVYIITMVISLCIIANNKNANTMIFLSLLTYVWTYYLVQQLIERITEVNIIIDPFFYIYLSSSIFLIISLFFNEKKQKNKKVPTNFEDINITNNLSKDNFIFASFIFGPKGTSLNTEVLLVNNVPDNSLDLIYVVDNNNQTMKLSMNTIKKISYKTELRMQNASKKIETNETKSMLLSAVIFGGKPMLQLAGDRVFNSLFDDISNNYDKVNFNVYHEIIIEALINSQEIKFVLNTDTNPEEFIKKVSNKIIK